MGKENYRELESLGYVVNKTARLMRKYFNKELIRKGYSLTGEQHDVLVYLWHMGEQNQQELARALFKDKTTMTRLIKSVEALNFVKRVSNKNDKRQKFVCLTAQGRIMMKDLAGLAQTALRKAQKGISTSDMTACKAVLAQINETLSQELTKNNG